MQSVGLGMGTRYQGLNPGRSKLFVCEGSEASLEYVSSYQTVLRKEKTVEFDTGKTRSQCTENSLLEKLCVCRDTDYAVTACRSPWFIQYVLL